MRIATWNVNGMRARMELILRWLADRAPDIVGLQELKLTEDRFPAAMIEASGYHAVIHGQKAWNGVAILSKERPRPVTRGLPGQEEAGARLVTAEVSGISFTSVYCPNGKSIDHEDYGRKLAWLDDLARHVAAAQAAGDQAVLCGDFNIVPAPLDSCDEAALAGTIFHTAGERSRFESLLARGFRDLFREKNPGVRAFSWWDYRAGAFPRDLGLRLDFILGTAAVLERVRSVHIDRDYRKKIAGLIPSDHAPVIADLD